MNRLQIEELNVNELNTIVNNSINTPENHTDTGELKECIILDLSKQLKDKFDELEKLEIKMKMKRDKAIKNVLKIYGLIHAIERVSSEIIDLPEEIQNLIDLTTDIFDDYINDEILF